MPNQALFLALTLVSTALVHAQDHPHAECTLSGDGSRQSVRLLSVKPATTTGWQCYATGSCYSYQLRAGDALQLDHSANGWSCGYVTWAEGAGPQWVRGTDLSPVAANANPPASAWAGTWQGGEDAVIVKIAPDRQTLLLTGTAVWNGANGNHHIGELAGQAKPSGNRLHYAEGTGDSSCVVDMTLIGDYILARDNQNCGGLNARFEGVWHRSLPGTPPASPVP